MYKNPTEIPVHLKKLQSKELFLKKICLNVSHREQFFFQGTVFLYFTKVAVSIYSSMDKVFSRKSTCNHVLCIYNIFDRYLKGIELFRNSSCNHPLMNDPFSFIKEQLHSRIVSNLLCFCITRVAARRHHTIEFQMEGEGGINRKPRKFRPK